MCFGFETRNTTFNLKLLNTRSYCLIMRFLRYIMSLYDYNILGLAQVEAESWVFICNG